MPEKFKNKYRIPSNRLRGWNYAQNGYYFITIVTHGRKHVFGHVENGKMILNDIGQIVYTEFFKSFEIRNELYLGEFVLMPNHLHAIVILDKKYCEFVDEKTHTHCVELHGHNAETHGHNVETHGRASLQPESKQKQLQFQRQPKSISSFVAGFKSSTIKQIDDWIDANNLSMLKYNKHNPLWQANYHDHIIRNEIEYRNISRYIVCNPIKWTNDSLQSGIV